MLRRLVGPLGSGATSALSRGSLRRVSTTTPSLKRFPPKQGLYDAALEKDSCGVGMVASLKAEPSHKIVADANTMLVRMSHRGGCGSEPNSGDGAGILTGVPDAFLRRIQPGLPAAGEYGVGNLFFPNNPDAVAKCKAIFEKHIDQLGLQLVAWRTLPVDNSALGPTSLESEPAIEQLIVAGRPGAMSGRELNRELWRLRILASAEVRADAAMEDFYVCSLHTGTVVYKGQLTPEQVWGYFLDLQQPDYMSHLALVHSRFSTNTFPSWSRAQPFRALCHNGEINTLRGNKNQMRSREASLVSAALGDSLTDLLPITSNDMSDSGNFDAVAELLTHAGDRKIHEAVMMMVPEAWQNKDMPPDRCAPPRPTRMARRAHGGHAHAPCTQAMHTPRAQVMFCTHHARATHMPRARHAHATRAPCQARLLRVPLVPDGAVGRAGDDVLHRWADPGWLPRPQRAAALALLCDPRRARDALERGGRARRPRRRGRRDQGAARAGAHVPHRL